MSTLAQPCRVGPKAKSSAVLEALRRHVDRYRKRYESDPVQRDVLGRLLACRTAVLGAHLCVCEACGWSGLALNSCRNRHCPQCQGHASADWLEARQNRMLPTPHFQVVFTLPAELRPIAYDNQELVYALFFNVASSILQDLAAQRLKAKLGLTAVLHTWTSELTYHPHLHFLVTSGGLHLDGHRWVPTREDYLFPGRILGKMFRGRFLEGLIAAFQRGALQVRGDEAAATEAFDATIRRLSKRHNRWVVHVEPPKGRPVAFVAKYLARYIKRVAIADASILSVTDTQVTVKTKRGVLALDGAEFVRRFLLHVLPKGFRKVRHYGLYAPGNAKVRLETARRLLPIDLAAQDSEARTRGLEICPACGKAAVRRFFIGIVTRFLWSPSTTQRSRAPP